jgi:hypothetical protein
MPLTFLDSPRRRKGRKEGEKKTLDFMGPLAIEMLRVLSAFAVKSNREKALL